MTTTESDAEAVRLLLAQKRLGDLMDDDLYSDEQNALAKEFTQLVRDAFNMLSDPDAFYHARAAEVLERLAREFRND